MDPPRGAWGNRGLRLQSAASLGGAQTPEQQVRQRRRHRPRDAIASWRSRPCCSKAPATSSASRRSGMTTTSAQVGDRTAPRLETRLRSDERPGEIRTQPHGWYVLHRRHADANDSGARRKVALNINRRIRTPRRRSAIRRAAAGSEYCATRSLWCEPRSVRTPSCRTATQGKERMVDIAIDDLSKLTLAIDATTAADPDFRDGRQ